MPEFVRVTDPDTGAHISMSAGRAKSLGLTPLKQSGTDRFGNPLPAKPRVDLRPGGVERTEGAAKASESTTTKEK